jgi:hypothetical protein
MKKYIAIVIVVMAGLVDLPFAGCSGPLSVKKRPPEL